MRVERVLQVHTRYRQRGGEDAVVEAERRLLEAAGIRVDQVMFDNAELAERDGVWPAVMTAGHAVWNASAARQVATTAARLGADVVHVHNTFAVASPAVLRVTAAPVVQTLHNYRVGCPAATAFRDGRPCVDCFGLPAPVPAVLHACVRGSHAQSAVAAATAATHRLARTQGRVATFVALTAFQRELVVRAGVPSDRVRVLPNFREPPAVSGSPRTGFLYAGRLAPEKGIPTLLEAARRIPGTVRVAGTGPLDRDVAACSAAGIISALGLLGSGELDREISSATALVVPSIWYEGFPMVVLDAFATGTPVIASRLGSLAEIVDDGVTGLLFEPGDPESLSAALEWAAAHAVEMARMGDAARRGYETSFTPAAHLRGLLDLYDAATGDRRGDESGDGADEGRVPRDRTVDPR